MLYLIVPFMVGCAVFFHRAAESDKRSGVLWTGLSVLLSTSSLFLLGWIWVVLSQLGLLAAMWGLNLWREREDLLTKEG